MHLQPRHITLPPPPSPPPWFRPQQLAPQFCSRPCTGLPLCPSPFVVSGHHSNNSDLIRMSVTRSLLHSQLFTASSITERNSHPYSSCRELPSPCCLLFSQPLTLAFLPTPCHVPAGGLLWLFPWSTKHPSDPHGSGPCVLLFTLSPQGGLPSPLPVCVLFSSELSARTARQHVIYLFVMVSPPWYLPLRALEQCLAPS